MLSASFYGSTAADLHLFARPPTASHYTRPTPPSSHNDVARETADLRTPIAQSNLAAAEKARADALRGHLAALNTPATSQPTNRVAPTSRTRALFPYERLFPPPASCWGYAQGRRHQTYPH